MPKERWREKKKRDWRDGETNCRPKKEQFKNVPKMYLRVLGIHKKESEICEICETNDSVLLLCCKGLAVIQKSK